ncbi:MAG: hypothetical protein SP1CHLAM54_17250 [Chlamydiia bacterium]|nr:hypothetical protein [Chlamydiia bacterium]MCH9616613.1 hypothetical protein [Chlamydiia bacterium]MCH9629343.1 hypothetical protein [Chlamydiia bacterium]
MSIGPVGGAGANYQPSPSLSPQDWQTEMNLLQKVQTATAPLKEDLDTKSASDLVKIFENVKTVAESAGKTQDATTNSYMNRIVDDLNFAINYINSHVDADGMVGKKKPIGFYKEIEDATTQSGLAVDHWNTQKPS